MRHEHTNSGTGKLLVGLLAGGSIGAALALLYAPEKGTRLRARLHRKSGELVEEAKEKIEEVASDTMEKAKAVGNRTHRNALKMVDTVSEKAEKALHGN